MQKSLVGAVVVSSLLAAAGTAQATPFTFNSSGSCSEACSATATITPGAGTLTVVLTDTQANPRSAGDLLSSIEITPSGPVGTPTLSSQSGTLITVDSKQDLIALPPARRRIGESAQPAPRLC